MKALTIVLFIGLLGCSPDPIPIEDKVDRDIPLGNSQFHWDTPTIREDGTPLNLSEIGGYRVYNSNSLNGNYTLIEDTQNTSYLVDTLLGYVYITTYDVEGDESKPSNIVFIE